MKIKSVTRAGRADVYNMEVDDTHDFVIQGGVISHNCADECRYMCMMRPIKPTSPPEPMSEADAVMMRVFDIEPGTAGRRTARPKMEIIRE